jgi:hypothetical protein
MLALSCASPLRFLLGFILLAGYALSLPFTRPDPLEGLHADYHVKTHSELPVKWLKFGKTQYGIVEDEHLNNVDGSEYVVKSVDTKAGSSQKSFSISWSKIKSKVKKVWTKLTSKVTSSTKSNSTYSDEFAKNKMLPMAAAAYSDEPKLCLNKVFSNSTLHRLVNVSCGTERLHGNRTGICSGFTALAHTDKAIVVAFRGTTTFVQLHLEASHTTFKKRVASPVGGNVSVYFMNVLNLLWTNHTIGADVQKLADAYPDYQIWITGHSLGGALASLAAAKIIAEGKLNMTRVKLYTFGQPRTGDMEFITRLDSKLVRENCFRITHSRDVVVHLPPHNFQNYTHHRAETWYSNKMSVDDSYTNICADKVESADCSNKVKYVYSIRDHIYYFDRHVSDFGINGCATKK